MILEVRRMNNKEAAEKLRQIAREMFQITKPNKADNPEAYRVHVAAGLAIKIMEIANTIELSPFYLIEDLYGRGGIPDYGTLTQKEDTKAQGEAGPVEATGGPTPEIGQSEAPDIGDERQDPHEEKPEAVNTPELLYPRCQVCEQLRTRHGSKNAGVWIARCVRLHREAEIRNIDELKALDFNPDGEPGCERAKGEPEICGYCIDRFTCDKKTCHRRLRQ
jgi:hypothetical protein